MTVCGVAAIYAYHCAAPAVERPELRSIRDHMAARGPDGQGAWFSEDGRVGMGHRRLSIIDLTPRAAQPMASADGTLVLSFNGEIYNYRSLRKRLEGNGHAFRSDSDTEVLLHLYAEVGEAMLRELRGMFAFALWDATKRALMLARDAYGIKPLYYADDGWTLRAASQVKALRAGGRVSAARDPAAVVGLYLLGSVPEPLTLYQEVRAVPAGSVVWVDELGAAAPRSWLGIAEVFNAATGGRAAGRAGSVVRDALLDSVRHHLVADVPVGAFLSAGVDSGSLLGLMRDCEPGAIQTVTLAFEGLRGREQDEAPRAAEVAKRYASKHTTRTVSAAEFRAEVPSILDAMDQPTVDGFNTWFASKTARELGLKVMISGLGGDELCGGYPSFKDIPGWIRRLKLAGRIPLLGDLFRVLATPIVRGASLSPKAAGMLKYGGSYRGAYLLRRGIFMPWELPALLGREYAREGLRRLRPLDHIERALHPDPGGAHARVAVLESCLYLRNQLLRDTDWASMAHSLEVRTPLVDVWLLRALAPVLAGDARVDGKRALAQSPSTPWMASSVLPEKTGFAVPMGSVVGRGDGALEAWKRVPALRRRACHWSRRLVYSLHQELAA